MLSPSIEGRPISTGIVYCRRSELIVVAELPKKKPYDVDYKVKTLQEIVDMQDSAISNIQTLLEVSVSIVARVRIGCVLICQPSTAAILLRHFVWNSEKLQEQFWNDPAGVFKEAGLSPPSSPSQSTRPLPPDSPRARPRTAKLPSLSSVRRNQASSSTSKGPFECPICCCDYPSDKLEASTLAMGCGHRFCLACWKEYTNGKIEQEGESSKIQCMESGCDRIVKEEIIDRLVDPWVSKK